MPSPCQAARIRSDENGQGVLLACYIIVLLRFDSVSASHGYMHGTHAIYTGGEKNGLRAGLRSMLPTVIQ